MNLFSVMVLVMSAIIAALVLVWLLSPALRARMEIPKHRMLERERQFGGTRKPEAADDDE